MAEKTFKLEIITPERVALSTDAVSVVVPGTEGSLGVLANHAPMMAQLDIGPLFYRDTSGDEYCIAISEGFMEVLNNVVHILVDTAELACDIDVTRAEEAKLRAQEQVRETVGMDHMRAEAALKRAIVRLRVARGG